jgi:hypothetical protein
MKEGKALPTSLAGQLANNVDELLLTLARKRT